MIKDGMNFHTTFRNLLKDFSLYEKKYCFNFISLFIISIDFSGKKFLDYLYSLNFIDSPMEVKLKKKAIEENEKSYRIKNTFFHSLKPNIKVDSTGWNKI